MYTPLLASLLLSPALPRKIALPPIAAVHPNQSLLGYDHKLDIISGSQFSGLTTFARIPYLNCFLDSEAESGPYDIAILGALFDTAVTAHPGARYGPGGIRLGSRRIGGWNIYTGENVFESWAKLVDCGDAPLTWLDNTVALKQLDLAHEVLSSRITNSTDLGRTPRIITLGGDHTTTLSALRSTYRHWGLVSVIHFDSHIDTRDPKAAVSLIMRKSHRILQELYSSNSGVNHGTFLHLAHEEVSRPHPPIKSHSIGPYPQRLHPRRHPSPRRPPQGDIRNDIGCGFSIIKARDLDRLGIAGVVEDIKSRVGDSRVYISVDIDVLDPAFAPATGTAEPGGLTPRELLSILDALRGLPVIGADVVEVAPIYDAAAETTTLAAAEVAHSLLGLMVATPVIDQAE
ncbi:hypothetical protein BDW62DRAFT_175959 [Aspergillus aurantiobrunneus]